MTRTEKQESEEPSVYGKAGRAFMRRMTERFARGSVRLSLGYFLDEEDVEQMRKEVLAHDFSKI